MRSETASRIGCKTRRVGMHDAAAHSRQRQHNRAQLNADASDSTK